MTERETARRETTREKVSHGDMRFHCRAHEFTSDAARDERVAAHWHDEYELLLVMSGRCEARVNGREIEAGKGDVIFFDSGAIHSLRTKVGTPLSFCAVDFGLDFISSYGNDDIQRNLISAQRNGTLVFRDIFKKGGADSDEIRRAVEEIAKVSRGGQRGSEMLVKSCLLRAWHFMARSPASSAPPSRADTWKGALAKRILEFLQGEYMNTVTGALIAKKFNMSRGQLCRFFKSQTGMTVTEYLNNLRIGAARKMLDEGDLSVSEIASLSGYNSASFFDKMFRRHAGCSPKEYRARSLSGSAD